MAKKEKSNNVGKEKKRKIIKVIDESKFKEIKSESIEDSELESEKERTEEVAISEENLESEIKEIPEQETRFDNFAEFISNRESSERTGERVSPILQSTTQIQEITRLEETAERAPATETTAASETTLYRTTSSASYVETGYSETKYNPVTKERELINPATFKVSELLIMDRDAREKIRLQDQLPPKIRERIEEEPQIDYKTIADLIKTEKKRRIRIA